MSELTEFLQIPEFEKENLELLAEIIYGLTDGKALLHVVGGAVKNAWPRKDIDLVIKMPKESGKNELVRAEISTKRLERLVDEVCVVSNNYFSRGATREPEIDRYVEVPDALQHTGSVTVLPSSGTPIELIRV